MMRNASLRRSAAGPSSVVSATLLGVLLALAAGSAAQAGTVTVTIDGMAFQPSTLRVARGDRIVWANKDVVPHTATATDGSFDSARIDPGQSWSFVVTGTGKLDYVCSYHPMMKGRLEVLQ